MYPFNIIYPIKIFDPPTDHFKDTWRFIFASHEESVSALPYHQPSTSTSPKKQKKNRIQYKPTTRFKTRLKSVTAVTNHLRAERVTWKHVNKVIYGVVGEFNKAKLTGSEIKKIKGN